MEGSSSEADADFLPGTDDVEGGIGEGDLDNDRTDTDELSVSDPCEGVGRSGYGACVSGGVFLAANVMKGIEPRCWLACR